MGTGIGRDADEKGGRDGKGMKVMVREGIRKDRGTEGGMGERGGRL